MKMNTVFVQIREAHAMKPSSETADDHWPLLSSHGMPSGKDGKAKVARIEKQPSTNEERREAFRTFVSWFTAKDGSNVLKDSQITFAIDPIDEGNPFTTLLNPWPARLFLFVPRNEDIVLSEVSCFDDGGHLMWQPFFESIAKHCM